MSAEEVEDRRLRNVYDALDSGNSKLAVRECDKVLKKHKKMAMCKALKALALARLEERDQALALIQEVMGQEQPQRVQNIAYYVYGTLGCTAEIVEMHEKALERDPSNLQHANKLFMAYIRAFRFADAQNVVMRNLRQDPNIPSSLWVSQCMFLQAVTADPVDPANPLFALALAMFERAAKAGDITTVECVLYRLLIARYKDTDAADTAAHAALCAQLAGWDSLFKVHDEYLTVLAETAARLGLHATAAGLWRTLIDGAGESPNWLYMEGYVAALLAILAGDADALAARREAILADVPDAHPLLEAAAAAPADAAAALAYAAAVADGEREAGRKRRTPLLFPLEVASCLLADAHDVPGATAGDVEDALVAHFATFGHKKVCFADMRRHLVHVSDPEAFLARLAATETPEAPDADVFRAQTIDCLRYALVGAADAPAETALRLARAYATGPRDADRQRGERHAADDHLLLAVHVALDAACPPPAAPADASPESRATLLGVAALLRGALDASPDNFEFRFWLAKVYVRLGFTAPLWGMMDALELKHIQLDTLGHHFFRLEDTTIPAANIGAAAEEETALRLFAAIQFYRSNDAQTPKYTAQAFADGSHSKPHEFLMFHEKLARSHQRSVAETKLAVLQMYAAAKEGTANLVDFFAQLDYDDSDDYYAKLTNTHDATALSDWGPNTQARTDAVADYMARSIQCVRATRAHFAVLRAAVSVAPDALPAAIEALPAAIDAWTSARADAAAPASPVADTQTALYQCTLALAQFAAACADASLSEDGGAPLLAAIAAVQEHLVGALAAEPLPDTVPGLLALWNVVHGPLLEYAALSGLWDTLVPRKKKKQKNPAINPAIVATTKAVKALRRAVTAARVALLDAVQAAAAAAADTDTAVGGEWWTAAVADSLVAWGDLLDPSAVAAVAEDARDSRVALYNGLARILAAVANTN